jgi:hypothetical protein
MICVRCQFVNLLVSGNPVSNPSYEDALNMCQPRMTKEQLRQVQNYKIELDTSPPVVCGGYMSYLRYLCLFVYNGVPHIFSSGFFFVLCDLCCQFLWITPSIFSNVYLQLAVAMIIWSRLHMHGYITSTVHLIEAEM